MIFKKINLTICQKKCRGGLFGAPITCLSKEREQLNPIKTLCTTLHWHTLCKIEKSRNNISSLDTKKKVLITFWYELVRLNYFLFMSKETFLFCCSCLLHDQPFDKTSPVSRSIIIHKNRFFLRFPNTLTH